jgi:RNA polymerase sigma factor (TIGR02999 family)
MSETTTIVQIQKCLDRLRQGDAAARDELIAVAYERLRRLAHQMAPGFPIVEHQVGATGVLHEAFPRLQKALREVSLTGPQHFFRVVALQMRRELIDLVRRIKGPKQTPGNPVGEMADPSESTWDPHRLAVWTNFHEKVESLPEVERAVFDLLWYQELTAVEAAQALGLSEKTVKRRWQAARRRLHDLLGGELPF